jgi:hypothetical protein
MGQLERKECLGESEDLLSEYERTRRRAFLEWKNPLSIGNKERLTSTNPEKVAERREFFKNLNTDTGTILCNGLQCRVVNF